MLSPNFSVDPGRERVELLILAIGLFAIAAVFGLFLQGRVFPVVLSFFALLALTGVIYQRRLGHDVYLIFALIGMAIGRVISPLVVLLTYVTGISLVGSMLRLAGIDKLQRDFTKCRAKSTMFVKPMPTTHDGFRRQS